MNQPFGRITVGQLAEAVVEDDARATVRAGTRNQLGHQLTRRICVHERDIRKAEVRGGIEKPAIGGENVGRIHFLYTLNVVLRGESDSYTVCTDFIRHRAQNLLDESEPLLR